jgi:Ion channel
MTTVGYGDIYPSTLIGKIIIFICSTSGVLLSSLYVVSITNALKMTTAENNSFTIIKRVNQKEKLKEASARVLGIYSKIRKRVRRN